MTRWWCVRAWHGSVEAYHFVMGIKALHRTTSSSVSLPSARCMLPCSAPGCCDTSFSSIVKIFKTWKIMNIFSLWTGNSYHTLVIRNWWSGFRIEYLQRIQNVGMWIVMLDPGLSCEEEQYHGRARVHCGLRLGSRSSHGKAKNFQTKNV